MPLHEMPRLTPRPKTRVGHAITVLQDAIWSYKEGYMNMDEVMEFVDMFRSEVIVAMREKQRKR